ncbi:general substrate transporter [Epithele typhae]|uniref:general substrate transporter n=1 Tax=Epithele typhae TaxID=378194 RepID=UPI002008C9A3|nr:general substrate transporter [Epithele typhae]KAH9921710.1 general substrate transporter [Epithele typhae]
MLNSKDSIAHIEADPRTVAPNTTGDILKPRLEDVFSQDRPKPLRSSFLRLYACLFVAYLCSATNGFDANTFGGLSATKTFVSYFGITAENQGIVAALYVVGNVAGCLFAGPCADRYGRRFGMTVGSLICVVGAVMQTTARNLSTLMGGRFILGLGAAVVQTAGPAYVVEMAYPKYRGVLTGAYQTCFFLGTIVSTWLEYGLNFVESQPQWTWRLPLAVQALPSVLVLMFVWFIPETPRWHIAHSNIEEARNVLIKYHGDGDPNSPIVALELEEMLEVISAEGSDRRWWDFRRLFDSRSARYRTFLISCMAFFGQWDLPPTSYYFPLMAQTAGITSERTQLLLNALQTPIMMAAALFGLRWVDRLGRRKLLIGSSTGMALSVAVITACTAQQAGRPVVGGAGIAFVYVFLVVFAFAWTPAQSLYPTEVLAFNTRAKGLAFMNLLVNVANVFNTYVPPVAIARASWRFYIFYVLWDALGAIVIYLTFVETKGRNLEEIDEIFEAENPKEASLRRRKFQYLYAMVQEFDLD